MRRPRLSTSLLLALLAALRPARRVLAQAKKLTLERLHADPPLGGSLPTGLAWHPDGKRLTYLRGAGPDLVALDAGSGREAPLLPADRVKHPVTGKALSLASYAWTKGGDRLLLTADGDLFVVDAKSGVARALVRTPETEELAELSPDGRRAAFVRKNDLYVADLESGRETRLTKTGSETVLNGRLDWVYEEELAGRSAKAFWWSPTSDAVAYLQLDQARVPTFPIVDFLPVHNEVKTQRYPKAGDPNAVVKVGVVGLSKDGSAGPERLASFTPDDVYVVPDLAFAPDGRSVAYMLLNRAQNELQLRLLPVPESPAAALGSARTVLTERSDDWLNAPPAPVFLKDGRRFLWLSERTGFAHVYLCETTGNCRTVTSGNWMVDAQPSFAGTGGSLLLEERTGLRLLRGHREGPPRAASLPRAPRRHRPVAPHQGRRHPPGAGLARRAALRLHAVVPGGAPRPRGLEHRRPADDRDRTRERPRRSRLSSAGPTSGSSSRRATGPPSTAGSSSPRASIPPEALPGGGQRVRRSRRADGAQRLGRRLRPGAREPGFPRLLPRQPGHHRPRPRLREAASTRTWARSSWRTSSWGWPTSRPCPTWTRSGWGSSAGRTAGT